jgi:hypothetical protein
LGGRACQAVISGLLLLSMLCDRSVLCLVDDAIDARLWNKQSDQSCCLPEVRRQRREPCHVHADNCLPGRTLRAFRSFVPSSHAGLAATYKLPVSR